MTKLDGTGIKCESTWLMHIKFWFKTLMTINRISIELCEPKLRG